MPLIPHDNTSITLRKKNLNNKSIEPYLYLIRPDKRYNIKLTSVYTTHVRMREQLLVSGISPSRKLKSFAHIHKLIADSNHRGMNRKLILASALRFTVATLSLSLSLSLSLLGWEIIPVTLLRKERCIYMYTRVHLQSFGAASTCFNGVCTRVFIRLYSYIRDAIRIFKRIVNLYMYISKIVTKTKLSKG